MRKKINLLIVSKSIDGGTGSYTSNLLKLKKLLNLKIKIITLEQPSYRKIKSKTIFLHHQNFYPKKYLLSFQNIITFLQEIVWLKKNILIKKPDVILSVNHYVNTQLALVKYLFDNKLCLILTTHNNINCTFDNKASFILKIILKALVRFLYRLGNVNIGVSKRISNDLRNLFQLKNTVTIYNGVKTKRCLNKTISRNKKNIVSIGRLDQQKDFFTLIKAYVTFEKKCSRSSLKIIGDGEQKEELEKTINHYRLFKKIKLIGWKQNVIPYLNSSNLFVLSSFYEGFPYVLLEAMSQGLPVISTNASYGPSEILGKGKYGVLVPVGDEKKMARAMLELLTNKKKRGYYAKKSMERARFFSEKKMLDQYKQLILRLLNND